jgi:hypothetical protein
MNILIACHKPPGFGHQVLHKLNTNTYKANKTRKNSFRNIHNKGNTMHYLNIPGKITYFNTNGTELPNVRPANNAPNWYPDWSRVPDNSMDILWSENCPIKHPFWWEEFNLHLNEFEEPDHIKFLDPEGSLDDIWRHLLQHGKRILKQGGKIIVPLTLDDETIITDSDQLKLILRIINMEVIPEFIYRVNVIEPFSKTHKSYLQNLFITTKNNVHVPQKFLVFEKP